MLGLSISGFLAFINSAVFMLGYITNNSLFPEPLTRRRGKKNIRKIQKWR